MRQKSFLVLLSLVLLSSCGGIETILFEPEMTPEKFCKDQPCVNWFGQTLIQPTSSILVFILALISIIGAFRFFKPGENQLARTYWGWMLLLGGIGALVAGISYQAFGYMIKCAGREQCVWTSYWELAYNILTVAGAGCLLLAVAQSCFSRKGQSFSLVYAVVNFVVYLFVLWYGLQAADRFLLSFEMMLLFVLPAYLVIILLNVVQFFKAKTDLLKKLLIAWLILLVTLGAYYGYLVSGTTAALWQDGIWFSENDVLHVGMLIWVVYVWKVIGDARL